MADKDRIEVQYNRDLKLLEEALTQVNRPGDFFVEGGLETPMPRVEVEGVGVLSLPVPKAQARELIAAATRAPYGRGKETILDESVRKVWQIPARNVVLGGKSWDASFRRILDIVVAGLGCGDVQISATLYKLLIYEEGGFFKSHRDTEKERGMFGTLVVVLPAEHTGGELVVRHAGREKSIDLARSEFSELRFAAFYADCEHEVLPVRAGHRVCLVFNLCLPAAKASEGLTPPLYDSETKRISELLEEAFSKNGPLKLAWLLEHEYSPEGLGFAALKGSDAARAALLKRAAAKVGCLLHLGIVHIQESGWAEHVYVPYSRGRSRRWQYHDDEGAEETESDDEFGIGEVCDGSRYIDQWRDTDDQPIHFGSVPLEDNELLPEDGLDGEKPDEKRFTEATGNEGASFERAYHRAALVIWPREQSARVLLQASIASAMSYLARAAEKPKLTATERQSISRDIRKVIEKWESVPDRSYSWHYQTTGREADRAEMLRVLIRLDDLQLLERFISRTVTPKFDRTETAALSASFLLLGPAKTSSLLSALARENVKQSPNACVELLAVTIRELGERRNESWKAALARGASEIVTGLPGSNSLAEPGDDDPNWPPSKNENSLDAKTVASLLDSLRSIGASELRTGAADAIATHLRKFNPCRVVVPALKRLKPAKSRLPAKDRDFLKLWKACAEFLLERSECPPARPVDWRQEVSIACKCGDCRELMDFANDPAAQIHRFRVRKDRRMHLHRQIDSKKMDMSHVTERKGSPQTLVCTKTHGAFLRRCEQYREDQAAMRILLELGSEAGGRELTALMSRLKNACEQRLD